ncbi:MAG: hypothetical protein Q7T81_15065 [Pseudolabrys sp.]|nr:hypothetical protein [Pseudolabrys sp.]
MTKGSFTDFLDALRGFESGVNAATIGSGYAATFVSQQDLNAYKAGEISLRDLQYTSTNSLGFTGYQVGEALLIDLGYYKDSFYYGNGAATNTWDGTFTGKGGVTSLGALESGLQEGIILDAFGHNLEIIENGLAEIGKSLSDFMGQSTSYTENGQTIEVTLSLTGILAAAHLRGAYGTLDLLKNGAVSHDENGTSILKYIKDFGGYDALSSSQLIQAHNQGTTGNLAETIWNKDLNHDGTVAGGAATPVEPVAPTTPAQPTTPATPTTTEGPGTAGDGQDFKIAYHWGAHDVFDFDPAQDTLNFGWMGADEFEINEVNGSVVISIPTNHETYTLQDVTLDELSMSNIQALDHSTLAEWDALI